MKFSVGYQLRDEGQLPFSEIVAQYRDHIGEVYFAWGDLPTGRDPLSDRLEQVQWDANNPVLAELKAIRGMGIRLDLLLNGNCFGGDAMSEALADRIADILDFLASEGCMPEVVTTASPAVAYMVKKSHPQTEVRASVNMRIGTVKGLDYAKHLFDSFYICRDFNRDFDRIKELKSWADANGKGLYLLANSGCLRDCSFQTFHDNLVAHHSEAAHNRNIRGFLPYACWNYLREPENWVSILQNTWIRPEDLHHYEPYFPMVKLATRMHQLPLMVIDAYAKGEFYGNLLDLFEPGFGPALAPYILDNSKFPADWFEKTTACQKNCHECTYCQGVLDQLLLEN